MAYAATVGTDVVKAGWLHRRTTFLHRWKKNYFVLDRNGDLRYFESPDSPKAEERIVIRAYVTHIKSGPEARRSEAPDGLSLANCGFIELVMRDRDNLVLCAETFDEIKAWQVAIEQARAMPAANMVPTAVGIPGMAPVVHVGASPYGYYNGPYNPYGMGLFSSPGYSGQVISTNPVMQQQVIQTPGTTIIQPAAPQVIVMDDDPWRYRHRYGHGHGHFGHRRNYWW